MAEEQRGPTIGVCFRKCQSLTDVSLEGEWTVDYYYLFYFFK